MEPISNVSELYRQRDEALEERDIFARTLLKRDFEVIRLRECIIDCLNKNADLADGDCCTLIDLKKAIPEWELRKTGA